MKKFFLGTCIALCACVCSCSLDEKASDGDKPVVSKELSDSISGFAGRAIGADVAFQVQNATSNDNIDKVAVMKTVQQIIASYNGPSSKLGCEIAMNLIDIIEQFEDQGISVDKAKLLNNFKIAFSKDSTSLDELQVLNAKTSELLQRVQEQNSKYELNKVLNSPESIENKNAGEKFISEVKANDPDVKSLSNGIAYKIEKAGNDARTSKNDIATINFRSSHIDGTVIESNPENNPYNTTINGAIPALAEALKLVGEGGKITVYAPAAMAYGELGNPQMGIGVNETIVFDIEVVKISTPKAQ